MNKRDDPTFRVMKSLGWRYEAQNDGFRCGDNWVSRGQAQAAIAAAVQGREYAPAQGRSPLVEANDDGARH